MSDATKQDEDEGEELLSPSSQIGRQQQTDGTPEAGVAPGDEPEQEPITQSDD